MEKELDCINGSAGTGDNEWMTVGKSRPASAIRGAAKPLRPPIACRTSVAREALLKHLFSLINVHIVQKDLERERYHGFDQR